jgi:hypothetical protein
MADDQIIALTRAWVEKAVIGLNLCPFAESVHRNNQIAYYVSRAQNETALMEDLISAIDALLSADPTDIDTAFLIHPLVLQNFEEYNAFIGWTTDFLTVYGSMYKKPLSRPNAMASTEVRQDSAMTLATF